MAGNSSTSRIFRLIALLAVLVMVATACESETSADATVSLATNTGSSDGAGTTVPSDGTPESVPSDEPFIYRLGILADITTTNYWRFLGTDNSFSNAYVLRPTKSSLFRIDLPSLSVVPALAKGLPAEPVADGGNWTVTQPLQEGIMWSDGVEFTAADVVFTFQTVRDAGLRGGWLSNFPYIEGSSPRLLAVEAVDDHTVELTFDTKPGLVTWPHSVGVGTIMSSSHWGDTIAEALASEDPAAFIYGADSAGDPSLGGMVLESWEAGALVVNAANPNYPFSGQQTTFYEDGTVEIDGERYYGPGDGDIVTSHTDGPFALQTTYTVYYDESAALLALNNGEIDYWINPLGFSEDLVGEVLESDSLSVSVNSTNSMQYLAFNLRKSPGSYKGFRQAVAYMIDREFLAENASQGQALPMYAMVPEGNPKWYNSSFVDEVRNEYSGLAPEERLDAALSLLKAEGFTWDVEPVFDPDRAEIIPGSGLVDPAGEQVPEIEILAPLDREDAARLIEDWLELLGVPATVNPTDLDSVAAQAWPGPGEEVTFDMYILGWGLGNAALPTFHESFWHSRNLAEDNDGNNSTGFVNAEFDAAADAILAADTEEDAYDKIWEAEAILADELPYLVLFNKPITEVFSSRLKFPFVETISGLQLGNGFPSLVGER